MAGTLIANTINTDTAGAVFTTQNAVTGIAKSWVNFNGSTNTVRASFNVSSVTQNGTGSWRINFAVAMPDANYAVTGSAGSNGNWIFNKEPNQATTHVNVIAIFPGVSYNNDTTMNVVIHGN